MANASGPGRVKEAATPAALLLAQRIRQETPELTESEAHRRAAEAVGQAVGRYDAERNFRAERARARLSELPRGADPKSSAKLGPDFDSYEAGRRRGERQRRETQRDVFAGLRKLGE